MGEKKKEKADRKPEISLFANLAEQTVEPETIESKNILEIRFVGSLDLLPVVSEKESDSSLSEKKLEIDVQAEANDASSEKSEGLMKELHPHEDVSLSLKLQE